MILLVEVQKLEKFSNLLLSIISANRKTLNKMR